MFDRWCERLVRRIERHHRAVVVGSILLVVVCASSLLRLRLDMDVLSQLPSRSRVFREYRSFLSSFGAFDTLVVLISGDRAALVPFAEALAEKLRVLPEVAAVRYRVDLEEMRQRFLAPHRYQLMSDGDFDELERRLEPAAIRERVHGLKNALAMPMSLGARRWMLADPLGQDELVGRSIERGYADPLYRPTGEYFVSADGSAQLMIVRPVASAFDTIFAERLMEHVRGAENDLLAGSFRGAKLHVGHTGSYVYALADKTVIQSDMALYFVFAPLAVLAIFHLGLRTLRILPFVVYPLLVTTAVTFAISLLLYRSLNMVSVAFAGIFYGLGIDSSIYFYGLLREKTAARVPLDRAAILQAVLETLREIGAANVVASITTAVAFLVIGQSDFTGVAQLGQMTAVAMLLNIVATFVLLPAMVFAWGPRAIPSQATAHSRVAESLAGGGRWIHERRTLVLVATIALLAAAGAGLPRVRLDTDFSHLRPGGGEAANVEQTLREQFGRVDAQGVAITRGGSPDEALEIAERVAARLESYRKEGLVRSYSTLTAFFPSHATSERRLARFRSLPRVEGAKALRAALEAERFDVAAFEGYARDLERDERREAGIEEQRDGPLAGLIEQHLRIGAEGAAVATYFMPTPGVALDVIRDRLERDLRSDAVVVVGRELAEHEFARLLENELVWFLAVSLFLNLVVVVIAEKRLVRGLAVLSPTLVALIVYLGVIGMLDIPIDPINLIVLPLLIGLGVDDCVYLVAHARHAGGLVPGVRRGAVPLMLAVGTTIAGFGSLGLSRFPALAHLGWLAAFGLSLCMFTTLVLVPALAWPIAREPENRGDTLNGAG